MKEREQIKWCILGLEKPFKLSQLFETLEVQYNIKDRLLILEVLNSLLDSGLVKPTDVVADLSSTYRSSFAESA